MLFDGVYEIYLGYIHDLHCRSMLNRLSNLHQCNFPGVAQGRPLYALNRAFPMNVCWKGSLTDIYFHTRFKRFKILLINDISSQGTWHQHHSQAIVFTGIEAGSRSWYCLIPLPIKLLHYLHLKPGILVCDDRNITAIRENPYFLSAKSTKYKDNQHKLS